MIVGTLGYTQPRRGIGMFHGRVMQKLLNHVTYVYGVRWCIVRQKES
jgi:hypothetical protein